MIFVNNAGVLGMCVHGTIGVVRTLQHLDRASSIPGATLRLETPVGVVTATVGKSGAIAVENVPARRDLARVRVQLEDRVVHADIAWGGNWFALVSDHDEDLDLENVKPLTELAGRIRTALNAGIDRQLASDGSRLGGEVDHVELFGPARSGGNSRNFVLCPGGAYDRSPCGTGTSAKIACLAADGELAPGVDWIQESIIGSRFTASYRNGERPGEIVPTVAGRAWITAERDLIHEESDPWRDGIRVPGSTGTTRPRSTMSGSSPGADP